jgi:hypothetical protein
LIRNGTIDLIALPMQKTQRREELYNFTESIYKVQLSSAHFEFDISPKKLPNMQKYCNNKV